MNKTIEEFINDWNTKTNEGIKNLKEVGSVLNENEEKIYDNYKIVI
jgi:hypothetical protein